jgi:DNA-binding SARP family transcriptional activator/tetratricopeptide (TPR) repeat protein
VELRLLGPVEVLVDGQPLRLGKRQHRLILGILGLAADRPVAGDRMIDLLWAEQPPARARAVLHSRVSELRAVLRRAGAGADPLLGDRDGYRLRVVPEQVDAHRFRQLLTGARQARSDERLRDALRQALGLWRGPALGGWLPGPSHDALCRGLESARLTATEDLYEAELRLGNHHAIVDDLFELSVAHPGRDRLTGALMLALHHCGRTAEAIESYQRARTWLRTELGIDPGRQLQRLHVALLRDDPALAMTQAPARPAPGWVPPRQLPPAVRHFAGRAAELAELTRLAELTWQADPPGPVVISAIDGTAGIGKTALAVHWAHSVADRFPDGQLYLNLRGFGAACEPDQRRGGAACEPDQRRGGTAGSPMSPAEAVRSLLDGLGVAPDQLPADVDAQVGRYRSLLAGRRVLVVLDNARDAEQVRPLLPGAPGCLALVTSRNRLSSLVGREGAQPLALELLTTEEARLLLARRLGADRVAAEPAAADDVIAQCAGLPLALAIVAARAASRPLPPLSTLAEQLRGARLDALSAGDPASDLRCVFSWSYHALGPDPARLLRLLGRHPGPELSTAAAASLAGVPRPRLRPLLAALTGANLLAEPVPGRYAWHDLLHAYAAELAEPAEGRAAVHRLLDHYVHSAHAAVRQLNQHLEPVDLDPPQPGVTPERPADLRQALGWFAAEHTGLLATVERAAAEGWHAHAWRLAWALAPYLERRGYWRAQVTAQGAALAAAEQAGDGFAQARVHLFLGRATLRLGRLDEAHAHLWRALRLHRQPRDLLGLAQTHDSLAELWGRQERHAEALRHARQALRLSRTTGHRIGQARALNTVGWLEAQLGHHRDGIAACRRALALFQELADRPGLAATWDSLGYAHHHLSDHVYAFTCYRHALDLYRQLGDRHGEFGSLTSLGDTYRSAGQLPAARTVWRQALAILVDLGHSYAEQVRARLAG